VLTLLSSNVSDGENVELRPSGQTVSQKKERIMWRTLFDSIPPEQFGSTIRQILQKARKSPRERLSLQQAWSPDIKENINIKLKELKKKK
jgi:hypothetical protein